jgi:peptidyl-prolyl cis-trans isomerase A (cyclophilin A)
MVAFSLFAGCAGEPAAPPPAPAPAPVRPAPAPATAPSVTPPQAPASVLPPGANPALLDPSKATQQAPPVYQAKFETTKGDFVVEVHRDWAPIGADRFYNLVKIGFFDDCAFFRAIDKFMVQFGISGYPDVSGRWRDADIKDDPVVQHNNKGMVTFATAGKDTRTTQIFINYSDNLNLDGMGFAPFGKVVSGMDVVDSFYKGYGEGAPGGAGPAQGRLQMQGNTYLKKDFPELDYVKKASIVSK